MSPQTWAECLGHGNSRPNPKALDLLWPRQLPGRALDSQSSLNSQAATDGMDGDGECLSIPKEIDKSGGPLPFFIDLLYFSLFLYPF